jgi:hypothetical protein
MENTHQNEEAGAQRVGTLDESSDAKTSLREPQLGFILGLGTALGKWEKIKKLKKPKPKKDLIDLDGQIATLINSHIVSLTEKEIAKNPALRRLAQSPAKSPMLLECPVLQDCLMESQWKLSRKDNRREG